MKVFTHILNGTEYQIIHDSDMQGVTLDKVPHAIVLWMPLNTKRGLDVCVHEALHGFFRGLPENVVATAGTQISELLWKLGFRYCPPKPKGKK
jgi:hypothetical protein